MTEQQFNYLKAGDVVEAPNGQRFQVGSCHCEGLDTVAIWFNGGGRLFITDEIENWLAIDLDNMRNTLECHH